MNKVNIQKLVVLNQNLIQKTGRLLFSLYTWIVFHTYIQLRIKGKENIPNHPFIIYGNHQSHLDGILLSYIAHRHFGKTAMIAAKDYWFDNKKKYQFASLYLNLIPIDRVNKNDASGGIKSTITIIKNFIAKGGKSVMILPEGTRSVDDRIKPFKKGIAILSKELQLPLVPVYIQGSGALWPKGKFWIRPGRISATIGTPITVQEVDLTNDPDMIRERVIQLKQA